MPSQRPVSLELHHEIEQFLFAEARLLDRHALREWLTTLVDREVRYEVVMREERYRKDRRPEESSLLFVYNDNYDVLDMRVRQFESGLQSMLDPQQRLRRFLSNISVFHGENENEYRVVCCGLACRFRRLYEHEQVVYGREDVLRRDADGALRIVHRRVELDERVSRNKNILFFL
jgi:3-phenylpropionate/cinnamic acid dioxygenase small subunit